MDGSAPNLTPQQQEAYLAQIRNNVNAKLVETMAGSISELCFKKCAGTSGGGLDSGEKRCLSNCSDRFLESMGVVTQSIQNKG